MEKMRRDGCGDCDRHDACAKLFRGLFNRPSRMRRREAQEQREPGARRNPFFHFLGEVAKAIESHNQPRRSAFRKEVETHVEPLLEKGPVRIGAVARALGCSRQTLYRRLKAEGVTFERLLDDLRRRLALRLLRDRQVPVKEAAYKLGFSDPAAFSRAFKRWTGVNPSAVRNGGAGLA